MPASNQLVYPPQFRDVWYGKAPPWLRTGKAELYLYTLQLCSDLLVEKMVQAIAIRFPGRGDPSQIPYLASDRQLVQGPSETAAAFCGRLQNAFNFWNNAGSRYCVAEALQSYLVGLSPGVAATEALFAIVSGSYPTVATWLTQYVGDPIGYGTPALATVLPSNFDWDGGAQPWRAWLVLYGHSVATEQSGTDAAIGTSSGPLWGTGENVAGVWVPNPIGTTLQAGFFAVSGLSGLAIANLGDALALTGSSHTANVGTFPIVQIVSETECVIANPGGVAGDAGPLAWSISSFPTFAPGLPFGSPGVLWGAGEQSAPPADTGSNVGGVWRPASVPGAGQLPSYAWGLSVSPAFISSIRALLQTYKSGTTYYDRIIVTFDVDAGLRAGTAYSPNSSPGDGNPAGQFGGQGRNVAGVWVPPAPPGSAFDAYCQGTGAWQGCTVANVG